MSTNNTVIHMRLYSLLFWYSSNRRNGQTRIQALRGAWAMANAKWTVSDVVIGNATIGATGTMNVDAAVISSHRQSKGSIE